LVLISSYYVKHLATLGHSGRQGWVFSGVGAGIAIAGLGALVIMVNQTGSAGGWQIFGAASLLIAVALSMLMGPEIPTRFDPISEREGPRSPVRWSHVIAYGAMGIGYVIPATYLPIMAREIVQSPLVFGWSWPVFGLAALMSTPLVGVFQRRFSNRQIWAGCQIIMAVGLIFPVIYPQIGAIIVSGFCVGGTFMVITMMGMVEAHRLAPPQDVMRHIAIMTTACALGQMIGPVFASWLYGVTQDFSASMLITSAALILTAIPLALNRRPGIGSTHRV